MMDYRAYIVHDLSRLLRPDDPSLFCGVGRQPAVLVLSMYLGFPNPKSVGPAHRQWPRPGRKSYMSVYTLSISITCWM